MMIMMMIHIFVIIEEIQDIIQYDLIDHHGCPTQRSNYEDRERVAELHAVNNNNDDNDVKKKVSPYYNPNWSRRYWSRIERGGPSSATCVICMEVQSISDTLESPNCIHSFCKICIKTYLQKDINRVKCPESKCEVALEMNFCRSLVPKQVFDKWRKALRDSEALILPCLIRCPLRGCAAVFVDDNSDYLIRVCPDCCHFCVRCKDHWHYGETCKQYQRSNNSKSLFANFLPRGIMMSHAKRD